MTELRDECQTFIYTFDEGIQVKFRLPLNWHETFDNVNSACYRPDATPEDDWPMGAIFAARLTKSVLPDEWNMETLTRLAYSTPDAFPVVAASLSSLSETKWIANQAVETYKEAQPVSGNNWTLLEIFDLTLLITINFMLVGFKTPRDNPGELYKQTVAFLETEIPLAEITLVEPKAITSVSE